MSTDFRDEESLLGGRAGMRRSPSAQGLNNATGNSTFVKRLQRLLLDYPKLIYIMIFATVLLVFAFVWAVVASMPSTERPQRPSFQTQSAGGNDDSGVISEVIEAAPTIDESTGTFVEDEVYTPDQHKPVKMLDMYLQPLHMLSMSPFIVKIDENICPAYTQLVAEEGVRGWNAYPEDGPRKALQCRVAFGQPMWKEDGYIAPTSVNGKPIRSRTPLPRQFSQLFSTENPPLPPQSLATPHPCGGPKQVLAGLETASWMKNYSWFAGGPIKYTNEKGEPVRVNDYNDPEFESVKTDSCCPMNYYTPNQACYILSRFSHVVVAGDSVARDFYTALLHVLAGDIKGSSHLKAEASQRGLRAKPMLKQKEAAEEYFDWKKSCVGDSAFFSTTKCRTYLATRIKDLTHQLCGRPGYEVVGANAELYEASWLVNLNSGELGTQNSNVVPGFADMVSVHDDGVKPPALLHQDEVDESYFGPTRTGINVGFAGAQKGQRYDWGFTYSKVSEMNEDKKLAHEADHEQTISDVFHIPPRFYYHSTDVDSDSHNMNGKLIQHSHDGLGEIVGSKWDSMHQYVGAVVFIAGFGMEDFAQAQINGMLKSAAPDARDSWKDTIRQTFDLIQAEIEADNTMSNDKYGNNYFPTPVYPIFAPYHATSPRVNGDSLTRAQAILTEALKERRQEETENVKELFRKKLLDPYHKAYDEWVHSTDGRPMPEKPNVPDEITLNMNQIEKIDRKMSEIEKKLKMRISNEFNIRSTRNREIINDFIREEVIRPINDERYGSTRRTVRNATSSHPFVSLETVHPTRPMKPDLDEIYSIEFQRKNWELEWYEKHKTELNAKHSDYLVEYDTFNRSTTETDLERLPRFLKYFERVRDVARARTFRPTDPPPLVRPWSILSTESLTTCIPDNWHDGDGFHLKQKGNLMKVYAFLNYLHTLIQEHDALIEQKHTMMKKDVALKYSSWLTGKQVEDQVNYKKAERLLEARWDTVPRSIPDAMEIWLEKYHKEQKEKKLQHEIDLKAGRIPTHVDTEEDFRRKHKEFQAKMVRQAEQRQIAEAERLAQENLNKPAQKSVPVNRFTDEQKALHTVALAKLEEKKRLKALGQQNPTDATSSDKRTAPSSQLPGASSPIPDELPRGKSEIELEIEAKRAEIIAAREHRLKAEQASTRMEEVAPTPKPSPIPNGVDDIIANNDDEFNGAPAALVDEAQ